MIAFAHRFSVCLWTLAAKGFTGLLLDWCRFWGWPVLLDWPPCPLVWQNKFLLIISLVFRVRSTRHLFGVPSEIYACHLFGVWNEVYACHLFGVPSDIYACRLLVFWMRSLFLTVYLLFKCCFVAWQRWFSQKLGYCVCVKIYKHLFEPFCVEISGFWVRATHVIFLVFRVRSTHVRKAMWLAVSIFINIVFFLWYLALLLRKC